MRVPYRLKLIGGFALILGLVLAAEGWLLRRDETRRIEEGLSQRGRQASESVRAALSERSERLAAGLKVASSDASLKNLLARTPDPARLNAAALELQGRIGVGSLWIADELGHPVAAAGRATAGPQAFNRLSPVMAALQGREGKGLAVFQGSLYEVAAVPFPFGRRSGVLAAAKELDDAAAASLAAFSRSEVTLTSSGESLASSVDPLRRQEAAAAAAGLRDGRQALLGERGERRLTLAFDVGDGVQAVVQIPWDGAFGHLRENDRRLLSLALAALLLALVLAWHLARAVAEPAARLAEATRRMLQGDHAVRVPEGGRDELGELARAFNQMVAGLQEREKIRSMLRKAVSKEIAEELLSRGPVNLGGEERTVTVLFSDIRGFTGLFERDEPRRVVDQLNNYFSAMAKAIERQGGVIDKFVGDAVMALFGAPVDRPDDAARAMRAALAMETALAELNDRRREAGSVPLVHGVGVHTGRAVAGPMGSEDRWSYTVVGDAVNLASRLQGLTRKYGTPNVVSRAAKEEAGGEFSYRTLDLIRVRGRQEPVEVFEVLSEGAPPPAWLAPYEAGVDAFRRRDFAQARALFEETLSERPEDLMSRLYLDRIGPLLASVPSDWDPAYTFLER